MDSCNFGVITEAAKDPFGSSGDEDQNMHRCDSQFSLTKDHLNGSSCHMFSINWAMKIIYKDRNL